MQLSFVQPGFKIRRRHFFKISKNLRKLIARAANATQRNPNQFLFRPRRFLLIFFRWNQPRPVMAPAPANASGRSSAIKLFFQLRAETSARRTNFAPSCGPTSAAPPPAAVKSSPPTPGSRHRQFLVARRAHAKNRRRLADRAPLAETGYFKARLSARR